MFTSLTSELDEDGEFDIFGMAKKAKKIREEREKLISERKRFNKERLESISEKENVQKEREKLRKKLQDERQNLLRQQNELENLRNQILFEKRNEERKEKLRLKKMSVEKRVLDKKKREIEKNKNELHKLVEGEKEILEEIAIREVKLEETEKKISTEKNVLMKLRNELMNDNMKQKFTELDIEYQSTISFFHKQIDKFLDSREAFTRQMNAIKKHSFLKPVSKFYNYSRHFRLSKIGSGMRSRPSIFPNEFKALLKSSDLNFNHVIEGSNVKYNILHFAIAYNYASEIMYILKMTKNPSAFNNLALEESMRNENTKIFEMLLKDERVNPALNKQEILKIACSNGNADAVLMLCRDDRVVPTFECLYEICTYGYHQIMEFFLFVYKKVDPTERSNELLNVSCNNGFEVIVKLLLKHPQVNPNDEDHKAFISALKSKKQSKDIIEMLLTDERNDLSHDQAIVLIRKYGKSYKRRTYIEFVLNLKRKEFQNERKKIVKNKKFLQVKNKFPNLNPFVVKYIYNICGGDVMIAEESIKALSKKEISEILKNVVKEKIKKVNDEDVNVMEDINENDGEDETTIGIEEIRTKLKNLEIGFTCPITQDIFTEPVILVETGQTYEKSAIEEWFKKHWTDPLSNKRLRSKMFIPNIALRSQINEWKKIEGENSDD